MVTNGEFMKKTLTIVALLIGLTPIASISASENLSVDDAKAIIWKMKYKDICTLHKAVFPDEHEDKTVPSNIIGTFFQKTAQCINKTGACVSTLYKTMLNKIFGKTIITCIIDTLKSATPAEQESIKEAIIGSYEEYLWKPSGVEAFLCILFLPIGIFHIYNMKQEQIKKVEAQRAQLQQNNA